jgi:thymidylate synthase (FAD)
VKRQDGSLSANPDSSKSASDAPESEARQVPECLTRPSVPALDTILGQPFRVLDDGFVRLLDYMGDDAAVVQAARISYGAGTKRVHEDRGLIRYLMRHLHTTPFEMCEIKLHVRVPMDAWRQWIRHRTANVNEYSTRYSVAIDAAQRTPSDEWRRQSTVNRQGSSGNLPTELGECLSAAEQELQEKARAVYEVRIAAGVAREQARKDLPLSTYTEAYWKIDLHNLLHFLHLRMDEHAQREIRAYAIIIGGKSSRNGCQSSGKRSLTTDSMPCNFRASKLRSSEPLTRKNQSTRVISLPGTVCSTAERMVASLVIASGQN